MLEKVPPSWSCSVVLKKPSSSKLHGRIFVIDLLEAQTFAHRNSIVEATLDFAESYIYLAGF